jgi:hypothetical protein
MRGDTWVGTWVGRSAKTKRVCRYDSYGYKFIFGGYDCIREGKNAEKLAGVTV